ncbi:hypothetical protein [Bacillus cereus]|uniref:hypothetical protein n=1 Tax=Bacillus cereus TaxID=1396 RepID=UPI001155B798|nr:hypothetical protein [Bacillus cereus]
MKEKNEKMNNKNKGKVFYGNNCCEVRACNHINIPKSELTEFVRLLQALGQAILVQYGFGCLGGGTTGTTGAQGPQGAQGAQGPAGDTTATLSVFRIY